MYGGGFFGRSELFAGSRKELLGRNVVGESVRCDGYLRFWFLNVGFGKRKKMRLLKRQIIDTPHGFDFRYTHCDIGDRRRIFSIFCTKMLHGYFLKTIFRKHTVLFGKNRSHRYVFFDFHENLAMFSETFTLFFVWLRNIQN